MCPCVRDRQAETVPQFVLRCARPATRGGAALTHQGRVPQVAAGGSGLLIAQLLGSCYRSGSHTALDLTAVPTTSKAPRPWPGDSGAL